MISINIRLFFGHHFVKWRGIDILLYDILEWCGWRRYQQMPCISLSTCSSVNPWTHEELPWVQKGSWLVYWKVSGYLWNTKFFSLFVSFIILWTLDIAFGYIQADGVPINGNGSMDLYYTATGQLSIVFNILFVNKYMFSTNLNGNIYHVQGPPYIRSTLRLLSCVLWVLHLNFLSIMTSKISMLWTNLCNCDVWILFNFHSFL